MLLEKSLGEQLVFSVTVSEQTVTLRNGRSSGQTVTFRTEGRLQLERWTHLTLQVRISIVALECSDWLKIRWERIMSCLLALTTHKRGISGEIKWPLYSYNNMYKLMPRYKFKGTPKSISMLKIQFQFNFKEDLNIFRKPPLFLLSILSL